MLPVVLLAFALNTEAAAPVEMYIIPHTHLDVGWLETFDSYYYLNVSRMFPGIIENLVADSTKRFSWAEVTYFMKWWELDATPIQQQQLRMLVNQSRWEFVDGGLVQHDQALVTAQDIVNHMTAGHQFLLSTFGVRPTIGWSLDPFGAGGSNAALYAAMGYNALVLNRIPWWDMDNMKASRSLQFVWQPSASLPVASSQILTHVLDSYFCSPPGFVWAWSQGDGPWVTKFNVADRAKALADALVHRAAWFRANVLLIPWGCDFMYQNASAVFVNTDMIFQEVNSRPDHYGMKLRYATPTEYFAALHSTNTAFPIRTPAQGDFFPLVYGSASSNETWAGFFTSRPTLKGASRRAAAAIHDAEITHTLVAANARPGDKQLAEAYATIDKARFDQAISLHHDAITGTMCVAEEGCDGGGQGGGDHQVLADYMDRCDDAKARTEHVTADMVARLALRGSGSPLAFVPFQDETIMASIQRHKQVAVVFTNALAHARTEVVHLSVPIGGLTVTSGNGTVVRGQVLTGAFNMDGMRAAGYPYKYNYVLSFEVTLPPLGFSTYFINACEVSSQWPFHCAGADDFSDGMHPQAIDELRHLRPVRMRSAPAPPNANDDPTSSAAADFTLENSFIALYASWSTGVTSMLDKTTGKTHKLEITLRQYGCTDADNAYIFSVNGVSSPVGTGQPTDVQWVPGLVADMLYVQMSAQFSMVFHVYHSDDPVVASHIDIRFDMGLLDQNTEVVVQFATDIQNTDGSILTDSNAYEMVKRTRNSRIATQQNDWPQQASVVMRDGTSQLSIVTEQSHGAILESGPGNVQIHLGRRMRTRGDGSIVIDDHFYHSQHILVAIGAQQASNRARHKMLLRRAFPPRPVAVRFDGTPQAYSSTYRTSFAPVNALPENLHLFSLAPYDGKGAVTLRVQHLYEAGEDAVYSAPATFDPTTFFTAGYNVSSVVEKTLNMNLNLAAMNRYTWNTADDGANDAPVGGDAASTLGPLQIRTFQVALTSK